MKLHIGTSGFSYKEWKGSFYPKDLKADDMLRFYGEQFNTVEINNTHYRFPKAAVLEKWAAEVPADFQFVLKAHRSISHIRRLKDVGESMDDFLTLFAAMKGRQGPLLVQLPPNFKKDVERLQGFLAALPSGSRVTLEFRHESWFDDEVFELLRRHDAALCIAEEEDGVEVPFVSTASWGYLRMRMVEYTDAELKKWFKLVQQQPWSEAYIFFKHEDAGTGPKLAKRFMALA